MSKYRASGGAPDGGPTPLTGTSSASSSNRPSAPTTEANLVWPPPDDEVDRVIAASSIDEKPSTPAASSQHPSVACSGQDTSDESTGTRDATAPDEPERRPESWAESWAESWPESWAESSEADTQELPVPPIQRTLSVGRPVVPEATGYWRPTGARVERGAALVAVARRPIVPGRLVSTAFPTRRRAVSITAAVTLLILAIPAGPDLGTLVVRSDPEGALVLVNGELHGRTPLDTELAPGGYVVELRHGGRTWRTPVVLGAGAQVVNYFAFVDEAAEPGRAELALARSSVALPSEAGVMTDPSTSQAVPVAVTARGTPAEPRSVASRVEAQGWLVVTPARKVTLLADGQLLDLVEAGEERRFALSAGERTLELVYDYESRARETRTLRVVPDGVTHLSVPQRGLAVISEAAVPGDVVGAGAIDVAGVVSPRPLEQPLPPVTAAPFPIPRDARAVVELRIDAEGRVVRATLRRSINAFYDERLLDAVRSWRYQPASQGARQVASTAIVEVTLDASRWSIERQPSVLPTSAVPASALPTSAVPTSAVPTSAKL